MAAPIALNHFVTDLSKPEQTSFQVLEENITSLENKSMAYNIVEKICYVALLALVATVFAVSYNLLVLTGAAPLAMAGMILVSPILVIAPAKFAQLSKYNAHLAENESKVCLKMRQIENWGTPQIEDFMRAHHLDPARVNRDALGQVNRQDPLKALLPLIARYQVMEERIQELRRNYDEAPGKLEQGFREKEAADGHEIPAGEKQKIRYESQSLNWASLEAEAIPTAFNAATLLQIIENPTTTDLDVLPLSFVLPNVGVCVPRNYSERMFGKNVQPGNDDYFVFHPDLHRPAISHQQIEDAEMQPHAVRNLLYVRA
ncbi:MAG: hypothetical protein K1X28_09580 [Parachlamydiales bacterium]|nr:hypothetical protein [Parachlamydiales bacterium]